MGVDIMFYIQKKENGNWKEIELFNNKNKKADIWRCGGNAWDIIKNDWSISLITEEEAYTLGEANGWQFEKEGNFNDTPYYAATLSKLLYLSLRPVNNDYLDEEDIDIKAWYKDLVEDIEKYIEFADEYIINTDMYRIVAFVSY